MTGIIRTAYVTTDNTGDGCSVRTGQGVIHLQRVTPFGVQITAGGKVHNVTAEMLPFIGRYFLAAAIALGVDINADWDKPQHHTDEGFTL